jgi:hypothetical protein
MASPHALRHRTDSDWIDREIASLRQSVGAEPQYAAGGQRRPGARPRRRQFRVFGAIRARVPRPAVQHPPEAGVLRRARRALRNRRFELAYYVFSIALAVLAGWVISSRA